MVTFTRHAEEKFKMLAQHGFMVTREQVQVTVMAPDLTLPQSEGRFLAQKRLSERHVLRVIYRCQEDERIVITFYPGRRDRL